MHLEHLPTRFQKLSERHGLNYFLAGAASYLRKQRLQ